MEIFWNIIILVFNINNNKKVYLMVYYMFAL